jgi:hypothetical protein
MRKWEGERVRWGKKEGEKVEKKEGEKMGNWEGGKKNQD